MNRTVIAVCELFLFASPLLASSSTAAVEEQEAWTRCQSENDLWVMSTRCLPCPHGNYPCEGEPSVHRFVSGRWLPSARAEFLDSLSPDQTLCVYVHGNRMSSQDAIRQGRQLYRQLVACGQPLRFVIWSWPSDRVRGPVRDAQLKAARADGESFYLACFLASLPPEIRVSLIGYSFGSRTVTGSLHLLAGGQLCGNTLPRSEQPRIVPRVVLLASALPFGWLQTNGAHRLAIGQTDRVYAVYNSLDPALKFFRLTTRNKSQHTIGFVGINTRRLGAAAPKVIQFNASRTVGRSHSFDRYTGSAAVIRTVRWYALWFENESS